MEGQGFVSQPDPSPTLPHDHSQTLATSVAPGHRFWLQQLEAQQLEAQQPVILLP